MTITKIPSGRRRGDTSQGVGIEIMYPGLSLTSGDSGLGAIGRIDKAQVQPGHLIGMHPHRDDEILTYVRGGQMLHRDTVGNEEKLDNTRFMMMNAGHTFQHEELMLGETPVRAMQIFMRPRAADLEPMVQFHTFSNVTSDGEWRLLAAPSGAPLIVRADVSVHDIRLAAGTSIELPSTKPGMTGLLYVFAGSARIGQQEIQEGEGVVTDEWALQIEARTQSDIVFFATDLSSRVYRGGMFSGNQKQRF